MTSFDERERAYESKFAHDAELKFKAEARRDRLIGRWAAEKMGLSGGDADDYAAEIVKLDLKEPGYEDVIAKLSADLDAAGAGVDEQTIRAKMAEFLAQAVEKVEADRAE